jgi:4-diphosphocytidyl-2-C-methyl-D-erythritol kinase
MREIAYAKLNLALHVRAREADGYHRIETIFAFCEDGDVVTAEPAETLSLEVTGPFADALAGEDDNLVVRAARATSAKAALTLDKRLPLAAGLGGGSADAAAVLRLFGGSMEIAATLGADVPACLLSRTARGEGRGDEVEPVEIPGLTGTPVLLVNPNMPLPTGPVFNGWDGVDRGPLGDWETGRNDLEAPARALVPEIGATCFGLYNSEAARDAAAARISAEKPGWWLSQTRLR